MYRRLLLLLSFFSLPLFLYAGGKIKYYFNHPVDNSVSTGVNAIYLNGTVDDTLISYINRAKYTIDVAVYNTTSSATNVMNAINAAYARNVKVRWIFDSSYQVESELNTLNPGIYKLGRPDINSYIMHNKFMVVDANSTDPNDAIVWTGSSNWNSPQFGSDYNNIVVVQDQAVARAYRAHFNMMWGDTGIAPNNALAKFGAAKTDLGNHTFYVDGNLVELYFSPKDGTNSKIQSVINSANVDIYFGMFTFTDNSDASLLVSKKASGLYVAGIQDQSSSTSSAASTLSSGLGSSLYKVYNSSNSYHNKFLIVDPSDRCSDPTVLTGSHNWSFTANTQNDENTLIIHDDTAANIYYQSFRRDFTNLGGSLTVQNGCTSSVKDHNNIENSVEIFPNPSTGSFSVSFELASPQNVRIELINAMGQIISVVDEERKSGTYIVSQSVAVPGIYIVKFNIGTESFAKKVLVN